MPAVADSSSALSCLAEVTQTIPPETAVSGPSCQQPRQSEVRKASSKDPSRHTIVSPTALAESSCAGNSPVLGLSPQLVTEGVGQATARTQSGSLFLELFAGTARMSKAFSRVGFQVLAVDSVKPQAVPALSLDLTKVSSQKLILDLVQSKRLAAIHLAPPCGTSSQARAIDAGPGSPQPPRSPLFADGLPGLSFLQRTRVSAANKLYQFTAKVIHVCHKLGILWSLENPQSSLFWLTSPMQELWQQLRGSVFFATFDSCVYGGLRKKATTFWSSAPVVQSLSLRCHEGQMLALCLKERLSRAQQVLQPRNVRP